MEKFKKLSAPEISPEGIMEAFMAGLCGDYGHCDDAKINCPGCVYSYENNLDEFKEYIKSDGENAKKIRGILKELISD